jgi:hypothetical protein
VKLKLNDKRDKLFIKKSDADENSYRVRLVDVRLALEIARLNPSLQGRLALKKPVLNFMGSVRRMDFERVTNGQLRVRKHFDRYKMPSALMVFAISQNTTYGDPGKIGFLKHNISNIQVSFNDALVFNSDISPQTPGYDVDGPKRALAKIVMPIGGIPLNWKEINQLRMKNNDDGYAFPHIYVPLCYRPNHRLLPSSGFSSAMLEPGTVTVSVDIQQGVELDKDYALVYYMFYDDISLSLDTKTKRLTCPYSV